MSIGMMLSLILGILGPVSLAGACVYEFLLKRLRKDPRHNKTGAEKLARRADALLVAAWLLFAAAYLCFQTLTPDSAQQEPFFQSLMTWVIGALVVLDIPYLYLRRSRPRVPGKKKYFWEI